MKSLSPAAEEFFSNHPNAIGRVLDLGCGTGRLLPVLSGNAKIVVGLDYSAPLLEEANKIVSGLPNAVLVRHDMREIQQLFPRNSFDFILKCYTSLGYFSYEQERSILAQCKAIARPNAVLMLDTFNSSWIKTLGKVSRRQGDGNFALEENYEWDERSQSISCSWTYRQNERADTIKFELDSYDLDRVDRLLNEAGWQRIGHYSEYSKDHVASDQDKSERLIVLASVA